MEISTCTRLMSWPKIQNVRTAKRLSCNKMQRRVTSALILRNRVVCTHARMMRHIAWIRENSLWGCRVRGRANDHGLDTTRLGDGLAGILSDERGRVRDLCEPCAVGTAWR